MDQHGCAKNQTDGELIITYLENAGFKQTLNASEADFILVNSCGFINSAKKESIDAVYNIKAAYPKAKIILTGCLAERYSKLMFDSMPELDGVFGNGNLAKIADFMKQYIIESSERFIKTYPQLGICSASRKTLLNFSGSAYVKITEGCSNHCSFCAIPLIRGEVRSRPAENVVQEIKELVEKGIYEINLIGQDLAAFGLENKESLPYLLSKISELDGDFVVRLLYIHPDHFTNDIIKEIKKDSRFLHYFDIPFQTGDDDIILAMNRIGPASEYIETISYIKSELPDAVIRTTFLTGFPGETDKNAENTYNFLKEIRPDWSGCFTYSREEDTPAYSMKPRVPAKVAKARAERLEQLQSSITEENLKKYVGITTDVLIEEIITNNQEVSEDSDEGLALGRAWFQAPEVDGCVVVRYDLTQKRDVEAVKPGNLVSVKILSVSGVDLDSRFIDFRKKK
ncbi:MAG: 30S ribosomal protein S12 methylthiotransferase RimO [Treponema sp.]|nr:30S ribosomal protein S12 methylthiotransferase RimO [Treponema sp.]